MPPPALAPRHDSGLDQAAELASLRAKVEAFEFDKETYEAGMEAVKRENKDLRVKVKATTFCVRSMTKHTLCLLVRVYRCILPFLPQEQNCSVTRNSFFLAGCVPD